ncbi:MucBP domain-containing protein [Lactobacillus panisapium]|uniref:MucBP domain-containing protein n=1 Tax=Lactobacillus panisapium TaxID=2012495 RepID=A0ABX8WBS0_9LACO|nr:MucBP domain-containing protein [Lactobacillus panisapium]QYN53653.1 MucBP domain-containing protein [Lactobacillus panisapium]
MNKFVSKHPTAGKILFSAITMTSLGLMCANAKSAKAATLSSTSHLLAKKDKLKKAVKKVASKSFSDIATSGRSSSSAAVVASASQNQESVGSTINNQITIHYVDTKGNVIAPDKVISGNVGEKYTTSPREFTDYVLDSQPKNATGTFSNDKQNVTYVYHKMTPAEAAKQAEHFPGDGNDVVGIGIDESGAGVIADDVAAGKHAPHKKGHKKHRAASKAKKAIQKIKVSNHTRAFGVNSPSSTQKNSSSVQELPHTGTNDHSKAIAMGLGSVAIIGSLAGGWYTRKKIM